MKRGARIAVILIACAAALALLLFWILRTACVNVDGRYYKKDAALLDKRDEALTLEQHDALQEALPDCVIYWRVPIGDGTFDSTSESIAITSLAEADVPLFSRLTELREVDASGCRDYEALEALSASLPEVSVRWTVAFAGRELEPDVTSLDLSAEELGELLPVLPHLHSLGRVTVSGPVTETETLEKLLTGFPETTFEFSMQVCGVTVSSGDTELDLSSARLTDTAELEAALPCLPRLERVNLDGCGLGTDVLGPLSERHPGVLFVWRVYFGRYFSMLTDETSFISSMQRPYAQLYEGQADDLRYCRELVALDLGHNELTSCEFVRNMSKLKYLILADNPIKDLSPIGDLKELVFLEIFMTDTIDYSPLAGCDSLTDLNISYTSGAAWPALADIPALQNLWWVGCPLSIEEREELLSALDGDVRYRLGGLSSTGYGWRQLPNYYNMRDALGMFYTVE